MNEATTAVPWLALGLLLGGVALALGLWQNRRLHQRAEEEARALIDGARLDAESRSMELLVTAQQRALTALEESEQRAHEIEERESRIHQRENEIERGLADLGRQRKSLDSRVAEIDKADRSAADAARRAIALESEARAALERVAGLTADEARSRVIASIEDEARREGARAARRIEDEAREEAERAATQTIVRATQRVQLREVLESTVTFIELPSDEMKGRIIGKEGRNIRALESATGIDLIVDDTPRSIWISAFDPLRREVARLAIERLLDDGRIHPARIEEVVERVRGELDTLLDQRGAETAFSLGLGDLHPRLVRMVGRMRYHIGQGQNLLQHSVETALLAGFMAQEFGGRASVAIRAGLLHEIGQVSDEIGEHPILLAADICARLQEDADVVHAIKSLHNDVTPESVEAILLQTANRLSEARPGARKDNLAVFVERLRRLEALAVRHVGVAKAFAVKAGRELRVVLDSTQTTDDTAYELSRQIAREIEREISYPGPIKVSVVRETRAIRYAV